MANTRGAKSTKTPEAPPKETLADILAKRRTARYYLSDDEPLPMRLGRILPLFGQSVDLTDPAIVAAIVRAFYATRDPNAVPFLLRRVTATEEEEIKAQCKASPREFDKARDTFVGGEVDQEDFTYMRLAFAILEPEVPGATLREKATWLRAELSKQEVNELTAASLELNKFKLQKAMEQVKN